MPRPRRELVSYESTPYYHCVSRCVRSAYLCGEDRATGVSYEHRRQWIEDRLIELSGIFSIDLASYAVMSNHYHVVLHIDTQRASNWTDAQVITRWHSLFKGHPFSQRAILGEVLGKAEQEVLDFLIAKWRSRLVDISWFMRVINEGIARLSNSEDDCTGRFWEGRFKSQALLDEKALLACMAYVDLNPVRAKMARTPENSSHTCVKKRIEKAKTVSQPNHPKQQVSTLMPFSGSSSLDKSSGLPFRLTDYLEVVDLTARLIRSDKRGFTPANMPPILQRLNIPADQWLQSCTKFESRFKSLVGSVEKIRAACEHFGQHWAHGYRACKHSFPS